MLTAALQTALPIDAGTVSGATVKTANAGATSDAKEASAVGFEEVLTGVPQSGDQEVKPDGTNASVELLDLILAQLPQSATINLPVANSGSSSEPLAMVDLDQVVKNVQTVAQSLAPAGISVFGDKSPIRPSKTEVSSGLHLIDTAKVGSSSVKADSVGPIEQIETGMIAQGSVGEDVYELPGDGGDPASLGNRSQIGTSQASELAKLILTGTDSEDVASQALRIMNPAGDRFHFGSNTRSFAIVQSQVAELLNFAVPAVKIDSGTESEAIAPVATVSQSSGISTEGGDNLLQPADFNPSAFPDTGRDELVGPPIKKATSRETRSGELAIELGKSTPVSLKVLLEDLRAQVTSVSAPEVSIDRLKNADSTASILGAPELRDVLLSRGGQAQQTQTQENPAVLETGAMEGVTPSVARVTEKSEQVLAVAGLDDDSTDQDIQVKPTLESSNILNVEQVDQPSTLERPAEVKGAVELKTKGLDTVARDVADLISARGPGRTVVRLNPENLGTIDIAVRQIGRSLDVQMNASDERVNHALHSGRAEVVHVLESRGMTVTSVNVTRDPSGFDLTHHHSQQQAADRRDFERAVNLQSSWQQPTPTLAPVATTVSTSGVDLQV